MRTIILSLMLVATATLSAQTTREQYANGQVKEERWVEDGRLEFVKYHENGRVAERGAFLAGKPDGIWKQYTAEGRLVTRVRFVHGLRDGKCLLTNVDGSQQFHLRYAMGKLDHGAIRNATGVVVAERVGE
jgi:antitoxin component YwqK of YwqJK toxin-antitoxin module